MTRVNIRGLFIRNGSLGESARAGRNSKLQTPSSREAPNSKPQNGASRGHRAPAPHASTLRRLSVKRPQNANGARPALSALVRQKTERGQGCPRSVRFGRPAFQVRLPQAAQCAAAFLIIAVLAGCSKGGPSKDISSSSFDSAPADVKQMWTDALASWKNHRYPEAAKNFVSLQGKTASLSKEQTDDLTQAMDEFGVAAFAAANKGDAQATEAVKTMQNARRRGGG
jgi:hypothetical protein